MYILHSVIQGIRDTDRRKWSSLGGRETSSPKLRPRKRISGILRRGQRNMMSHFLGVELNPLKPHLIRPSSSTT